MYGGDGVCGKMSAAIKITLFASSFLVQFYWASNSGWQKFAAEIRVWGSEISQLYWASLPYYFSSLLPNIYILICVYINQNRKSDFVTIQRVFGTHR